ncbi:MAG: hypothetical protein K2N03_07005, partial [Muribaculaceae bacterium]|nr:hypothetical protein [Muribaculaceae bacterium]
MRLSSLSSLLDDVKASRAINDCWDRLEKLRTKGSGWSWCPKMEPSFYITTGILIRLGRLKKTGYINFSPAQTEAIEEAIAFADEEILKDYRRYGDKTSLASTMYYLYARSFFKPKAENAEFLALRTRALNRLSNSWKTMGVADKATTVILFARDGNLSTARAIIKSLTQYSTYRPEQGRWFDNLQNNNGGVGKLVTTARVLEAYSEIEPSSPEIDEMRQWLILQRRGEDWGARSHITEVVQSVLTTGTNWDNDLSQSEIYLNEKKLEPGNVEKLSGMITMDINRADTGMVLRIEKKSEGPSWGGIVSQYEARMQSI